MPLDPETLLSAYAQGAFPMSDRGGIIRWYTADPRGVIPLDQRFHVPGTLKALVRQRKFDVRINCDFERTMQCCAEARPDGTWIGRQLIAAYCRLHELGFAHSVECYDVHDQLVGGLYGVSLGGAFFGESMFHRVRDASKVALVHLVERLRERGFLLLDAQASTPHLQTFGCEEIPGERYLKRLREAIATKCVFD
ncbi:MAG TPA: leucyl/phenylalanyl-tRNA--protein transferase [Tepidisphaeraceae bacterium]|nr:leucyl/phenylalanyl-tRNA--protein transferase [Tepidisphaeraceae bacterium]